MSEKQNTVAEATCLYCGCAYFEIVGRDVDPERYKGLGAVRLSGRGAVIAISGSWICYECGEPVRLPQISAIPDELNDDMIEMLSAELPPLVTRDEMDSGGSALPAASSKASPMIDPSRAAPD